MTGRYEVQEIDWIWSMQAYWAYALRVELAVVCAQRDMGRLAISGSDLDAAYALGVSAEEIDEIEATKTRHDVKAFLEHVSPRLPESIQPYFHNGMTSYDLVDTVRGLQMSKTLDHIEGWLSQLMTVLKKRAYEFKNTPQIGRTHGIHAECITFGVKLARFYDEAGRHMERIRQLKPRVAVGKFSGAVGMHSLDPEIEERALKHLNLSSVLSTQIVPRDIFAEFVHTLVLLSNFVANIAFQIRLLAQTEIGEVQEFFRKKQTGSSAMPHKRNPISAENLSGQDYVMMQLTAMAYSCQQTFHERSLDNSAPEREFLPLVSHKCAYMLNRATGLLEKMVVNPERMEQNIWITRGLIFSQNVMRLVVEQSELPREEAHDMVRQVAQTCLTEGREFLTELQAHPTISRWVDQEELLACFDVQTHLKHVDYIFRRAFGE